MLTQIYYFFFGLVAIAGGAMGYAPRQEQSVSHRRQRERRSFDHCRVALSQRARFYSRADCFHSPDRTLRPILCGKEETDAGHPDDCPERNLYRIDRDRLAYQIATFMRTDSPRHSGIRVWSAAVSAFLLAACPGPKLSEPATSPSPTIAPTPISTPTPTPTPAPNSDSDSHSVARDVHSLLPDGNRKAF